MRILITLLVFFSLPAVADIIPVPGSLRVKPVFDSADLVCNCTIRSVEIAVDPVPANGTVGWVRQRTRVVAEIRDIYKQDQIAEAEITMQHDQDVPSTSASYSVFQRGDTFQLFLKTSTPGEYRLADPFLGATHFAALPQIRRQPGFDKLEDALTIQATRPNQDDAVHALQLLEGIDDPTQETLSAMQALSNSADPQTAFTAVSVEMNSRKAEVLGNLISRLSSYHGRTEPWALTNIATKLAQFRGDQATPFILQLARSKYASIRDGALQALRAKKDVGAVPTLIERLDDSNSAIQYLAVITLAETLGRYEGDYAPSMYLFDKKPQYYIALWKKWWADEGSKLYPQGPASKPS